MRGDTEGWKHTRNEGGREKEENRRHLWKNEGRDEV